MSSLLLDYSEGGDGAAEATLREVDAALREDGIFLAVGHGISSQERASTLSAARALFGLDQTVKSKYPMRDLRGFIPFSGESGLTETVFEPKEGFSYGYDWRGSSPAPSVMHAPNVFPNELDSIHIAQLERHRVRVANLAERLATALRSLPDNAVQLQGSRDGGEEISLTRVFHYLPLSHNLTREGARANQGREMLGSASHTDWGSLTVILEDGPGLQFWRNDAWFDVPHQPEALVVNCGDFLSISTQQRYKSPIHRVLTPQVEHRLSLVHFHYPGADSAVPGATGGAPGVEIGAAGEHNTLLMERRAGEGDSGDTSAETFADLIRRKWRGVYKL